MYLPQRAAGEFKKHLASAKAARETLHAKRWFDAAVERIGAGTPPATAARLWLGSSFTHHSYYRSPLGGEAASRAVALYRETGDALVH